MARMVASLVSASRFLKMAIFSRCMIPFFLDAKGFPCLASRATQLAAMKKSAPDNDRMGSSVALTLPISSTANLHPRQPGNSKAQNSPCGPETIASEETVSNLHLNGTVASWVMMHPGSGGSTALLLTAGLTRSYHAAAQGLPLFNFAHGRKIRSKTSGPGYFRSEMTLRPLVSGGTRFMQTSGAMRREIAEACRVVIVREGGRSGIPEAAVIEPISCGVLDTRLRGYDDRLCGEWIASLAITLFSRKAAPPLKLRPTRNNPLLQVSGGCAFDCWL